MARCVTPYRLHEWRLYTGILIPLFTYTSKEKNDIEKYKIFFKKEKNNKKNLVGASYKIF
jgi:hypothetical protein